MPDIFMFILELEGNIKDDLILSTHFTNKETTAGRINCLTCPRLSCSFQSQKTVASLKYDFYAHCS